MEERTPEEQALNDNFLEVINGFSVDESNYLM